MASPNDEHNDDWIFDDTFPYPSEYDRERGEWIDEREPKPRKRPQGALWKWAQEIGRAEKSA